MATSLVNAQVNQDASFSLTLTLLTDPTDPTTAIDLTGCTARMMVKANYAATSPTLLTLTDTNGELILGGTAGTVEITMTPAQTLSLSVAVPLNYNVTLGPPSQNYVADLYITFPSGQTIRYVNFVLTVFATVTR